jgi:phospho-N-acetylmuramoyl-pentapeptide-transferase
MLYYAHLLEDVLGPLRLFKYTTVRMGGAAVTALIIGFLIAPSLFARLRALKAEQVLRDKSQVGVLADLHASKKSTPTMGGLMIYVSVLISTILWVDWNLYVLCALWVYTVLTGLGFIDDFLKVRHKNSKGVPGRIKLMVQALLTLSVLGILALDMTLFGFMQQLWVPCVKFPIWEVMPIGVMFVFFFFVIAGSSNAINLTDGIDGLAIGCTLTTAITYGIMAYCMGHKWMALYLDFTYLAGAEELCIILSALVGASLVFLWYNAHPAEVFMGDTGSLAIGGLIGMIAILVHQPFTLVIVGGVFCMEAASVILQVASFKMTGKRIFRMSPIHHHFELKGWHENKVVIRFWILSLICALAGLATLKLR